MKHPLPLLFALMTMVVLLGVGSVMNGACKTSAHPWCAPAPKVRQAATRIQKGDKLTGHGGSQNGSLSQR